MLRASFPTVVNKCFQQPIRTYVLRKNLATARKDNAGIRKQHELLQELDLFEEDPEMSLDADFHQVGQSHREHENELRARKEQIKYFIYKNKYFKDPKLPNFITWAEKEQIRKLHADSPDEWSIERLAESFPATPEIIIKVLKSRWSPASLNRVRKYDEGVKKNWELLKAGSFKDLDPELIEHLKKFSNRKFSSEHTAYSEAEYKISEFQFPKPKNKEFLHIIQGAPKIEKTKEITAQPQEQKALSADGQREDKLQLESDEGVNKSRLKLSKSMQRKVMTYEELMNTVKNNETRENVDENHLKVPPLFDWSNFEQNDEQSTNENQFEVQREDQSSTLQMYENELPVNQEDFKLEEGTTTTVDLNQKIAKYDFKSAKLSNVQGDVTLPNIRYKIEIPKKLHKRGSVYKLFDCFYDDRGFFMYRVPGLR